MKPPAEGPKDTQDDDEPSRMQTGTVVIKDTSSLGLASREGAAVN